LVVQALVALDPVSSGRCCAKRVSSEVTSNG
jgi:hypothetical protein